ncbi:response regulator transcription factor [Roseococcus suduntuyensis]|uniref:FixJ family two-component response regulator n=1 Tax=Roseococcus suduntuyensis TaxID=455361 RepID=A0A840AFK6_9PROT|nr:response regulator [Roseococcus suduntuyensis]MBB3899260.1 FixJ family two-component response regulator [Roseococcus suduntuyensis]
MDDDEAACEAVAALVRSLGYAVAEFRSASAFLQSSDLAVTACLIVDMRMPGMGGLDLYRHLLGSGTPVPTIIMTAHATEASRSSALDAGVRCYLPKPVRPDVLLACIRSAIARRA